MGTILFAVLVLFAAGIITMLFTIKESFSFMYGYSQLPNPLSGNAGWIDFEPTMASADSPNQTSIEGSVSSVASPSISWTNVAGSLSTLRPVFSTATAAQTFCDGNAACLGIVDNTKGTGDPTMIGYIALQQMPAMTTGWKGTVAYVKNGTSVTSFPAIYKYVM